MICRVVLMECYVLTGINRKVLEELIRRHIRTLEIRSAHNVATALSVNVGGCVFITPAKLHDLERGVWGLVAEVTGKEVMSHSIVFSTEGYLEESEMTVVRLRLTPRCMGRVKRIQGSGILEKTVAEVVELSHFDAR